MGDSMRTMCVLILVSWTIYGCDGYILSVVNSSCEEEGVMHDMRPLTLSSIYDNNDSIGAAYHLLENGDQVRVSGHADFLPPFVYYGCYNSELTVYSERVYSELFKLISYEIEPTRPLYDCLHKCNIHYDGTFYMGLGLNRCVCTDNASLFYTFKVTDTICVESFKDMFRKVYTASNLYNIVTFEVDNSLPNHFTEKSPKSEPFLMLSSFAVLNDTGNMAKTENEFSFDYGSDVLCIKQPSAFYTIGHSDDLVNLATAHSKCFDHLMRLATRQSIGMSPIFTRYRNSDLLLGDLMFLRIYDSKPVHDNSCVMLEMKNGKLFVESDNCSFQRPFLCIGESGNASNKKEVWLVDNATNISNRSYSTDEFVVSAHNGTETSFRTMLNDDYDSHADNDTANSHESNLNDEEVGFANNVTSTSNGSAVNNGEEELVNYIVPAVILCVACSICFGIFLLYRHKRSNKLCCSCNKASNPTIALNHSTSINVPGRTIGHTNSGSVCVRGRTAGNANTGSICVPGRTTGQTNSGSVCVRGRTTGHTNSGSVCVRGRTAGNANTRSICVPGRTTGHTNSGSVCVRGRTVGKIITGCTCAAGNVQGTTTTDCVHCRLISTARNRADECVSSDGAVPGCNNIGKYCLETPAIQPKESRN